MFNVKGLCYCPLNCFTWIGEVRAGAIGDSCLECASCCKMPIAM